MFRRLVVLFFGLALLVGPAFATSSAAQINPVDVDFVCMAGGRAYLTATNNTDREIRITAYSRTTSSWSLATSLTLAPGETSDKAVVPTSAPEYGWSLIAEYTTAPGGSFWEQSYREGDCIYDGGDPGENPTGPVAPTATLVPSPTNTPVPSATETPMPNSFNLTAAQRMCADQSFSATWTGANIDSLAFSLTNTSDEWTTGFFEADPVAGSIAQAVDHHSYDKVMAVATFADGTSDTVSLNVGSCTEVPAPPAPVDPAPSTGDSVTSLPSTGAGSGSTTLIVVSALALAASSLIVAGSLRHRH